eukprot:TRINITY_DN21108_c0_g1_i1.p1 TRINITY_DN21108_c0_g1~~TRINITY_DN21108_c0_g1_i1.p1  ORF type:complete len:386 (+),score=55.78 TRINITY_DN21108_c0_g1_i1:140-1297(+)
MLCRVAKSVGTSSPPSLVTVFACDVCALRRTSATRPTRRLLVGTNLRSHELGPQHFGERCPARDSESMAGAVSGASVSAVLFASVAAAGAMVFSGGPGSRVACSNCFLSHDVLDDAPRSQSVSASNSSKQKQNSASVSAEQEMLKARRLFITGDINDDSAKTIVQQLLYMESADPNSPVTLFINSGGGLVHSGLAILDIMVSVSMPVHTVGYGRCFSVAAVLLAAGEPGHRRVYSNTRLMIHEPSCSYPKLQATDIIIKADELRNTQLMLENVLSEYSGKSKTDVRMSIARDNYMSAVEAKEFGLIDIVVPVRSGSRSGSPVSKTACGIALPSATTEQPDAAPESPSPVAPSPETIEGDTPAPDPVAQQVPCSPRFANAGRRPLS